MNLTGLLMFVGAAVVAFFAGKFAIKGDTAIEDKKRIAIRMASWASANGLSDLAQLLTSLAINDLSGVFTHFRAISDVLASPEDSKAMLDRFLGVQLTKKVATKEGQEELIKFIEDAMHIIIDRNAITQKPVAVKKENENAESLAD